MRKFFQKSHVAQFFINSIIVAGCTTFISLVLATMAGFGFNRYNFKMKAILQNSALIVRMIPALVYTIPYYIIYSKLHLLDTLSAIIISHISIGIPLTVMMMTTFYNEVPKEMEEASRVDGASVLTTYFRVVVPTTLSGMAATAILMVMTSWNEFLLASGLASNHAKTFPIVIAGFVTDKGTDWGGMAALSIVAMVPMVLIVLFTQKYLIRGLTAGAVKG